MSKAEVTQEEIFKLLLQWRERAHQAERINADLLAILEVIEQAADMPFEIYDEVKAVIARAYRERA